LRRTHARPRPDRSRFHSPVGAADHNAWLPPWKGYQAFYKISITDDVSQITGLRLLDSAEPMHAALARDNTMNAFGLVHWPTHRSTWTTGDYSYLQDLFVAPEARGGGVGRRLIEHVYHEAATAGCSRVYWLIHETNRGAMALYDRVADRTGFLQYRKALG
jgi:GNAT superfamily N-acetyltransferase